LPVLRKIVSGGQTGADRAGLDFAIEVGLAHGGYVAKGRKAEDGRIDEKYRLTELATNSYPERTKRNVRESDGTIILSLNEKLSGGSALTLSYARHANKPVLHIHNSETGHDPLSHQVRRLKDFIESKRDRTLECSRSAREQRTRCLPLHTATTPAVLAAISIVAFSLAFPPALIFSVPEIIISLACAETAFRHNS
jgi:Circularly permutated YpsA SLOG family